MTNYTGDGGKSDWLTEAITNQHGLSSKAIPEVKAVTILMDMQEGAAYCNM
jgi:hypothetical protein